jgi:hypothetical protein
MVATNPDRPTEEPAPTRPPRVGSSPWRFLGLLFLAFCAVGLVIYAPVLRAPAFSDDAVYLSANPWIQELSASNAAAWLDPWSAVTRSTQNYNPVNLLLLALEWRFFGREVLGYHVVNVLAHALASTLLVALLVASSLPRQLALIGGVLFFAHPAAVEVVAWISQLKTTASLCLALAALLLQRRHPLLAVPVFALALLVKPSAAAAAPVAFALEWVRSGGAPSGPSLRARLLSLAGWVAVLLGFVILEFPVSTSTNVNAELHADLWVRVRSIPAFAVRYLAMGLTSYGLSPFQDPPRAISPLDPWWLASLALLPLLAWRFLHVLRRRREELAYWVWAAGSFALVCQVVPFTYAMADRYLYYMLPGLIGVSMLAALDLMRRLDADSPWKRRTGVGLAVAACLLAGFYLVRTADYARIWRSPALVYAESMRNFPEGRAAYEHRAANAARVGDAEAAAAALRVLTDRGESRFEHLVTDPRWASVREDPRVKEVIRERATWWIEQQHEIGRLTWMEHRLLAHAHMVRGEYRDAARHLEVALSSAPIQTDLIERELAEIRAWLEAAEGP